jgi:hypothetical protein
VDDQEYEFTVGSAFVKVKGFEAVDRDHIGELVWIDDVPKIMITQQHVANWIRNQKKKGKVSMPDLLGKYDPDVHG